jgi:hypothetical protein
MATVLFQFHPPEAAILLKHGKLMAVSLEELKSLDTGDQSLIAWELLDATRRFPSVKDARVTVIDGLAPEVSHESVVALAELVTDRWQETSTRRRQTFSLTPGKREEMLPQFTITPALSAQIDDGITLLIKEKRFRFALERWYTAICRSVDLDAVLDLCSSLEACFAVGNELRLRLAFAVYTTLRHERGQGFRTTYKMYNIRSRFVHGENPGLTRDEVVSFAGVVAEVLRVVLAEMVLPSAERLHSAIEKFID